MNEKRTVRKSGAAESDFMTLNDLGHLCLAGWRWFVLSLIVTLSFATAYLLTTPPIYTRTASMLIKDDSKGGNVSSNMEGFADLGLFKSNTNINNELLSLQSPFLMKEVVERLGLNQNYSVKDRFRSRDLYDNTPVTVVMDSLYKDMPLSFRIEFLSDTEILLSDFVLDDEPLEADAIRDTLTRPVQTPAGKVYVNPTSCYKDFPYTSLLYTQRKLQDVADDYVSLLNATLGNEDATIVDLSITDTNIRRAEDLLNMLITVYNENWIKDKNRIAVSTSQFIDDRLQAIEQELGSVDNSISTFKSENLLPDVQAASTMYMARSSENTAKLLTLNNQISIARYIRRYLDAPSTKGQLLPANSGIESGNVEQQISEYNNLLLDRNNLLSNSSEKNPLIMDMNASLASLRQAIIRSIDNLLNILHTQVENVRVSEKQTNARIASNPDQAKYLLSVERQQKVKEELYLYLLQKREENELSQAFTAYNTRVVNPPYGKMFPTAPRKMHILLVALGIGFLIPFVLLFLKENLNTTVRGKKDLDNLSMPFIGEIPFTGRKKRRFFRKRKGSDLPQIVVEDKNRNVINEAFRVVRTNLEFMTGRTNQSKVLMLTSVNPDSGKTFISMNLAASLAIKNKKVVVIDLDLRNASLSKYIGSPQKGISDYLGGRITDIRDIIIHGKISANLDLIPVGTIPPNPAELLFEERLGELLKQLRLMYDYIFFDCPPIGIVTDADIISRHADMTLFIIRAGLLDRRFLPDIEQLYTEQKYPHLSVLLNGTEVGHGHYYYKYGYSYGGYY